MSRAHAHTCEDLDPDLADAVSIVLIAVTAEISAAAADHRASATARNRLSDAVEQFKEGRVAARIPQSRALRTPMAARPQPLSTPKPVLTMSSVRNSPLRRLPASSNAAVVFCRL